jgi:hypothetical protein
MMSFRGFQMAVKQPKRVKQAQRGNITSESHFPNFIQHRNNAAFRHKELELCTMPGQTATSERLSRGDWQGGQETV